MSERSNQIFGGVFLMGLALLFIIPNFWWPGIMFVIGAAILARTYSEGKDWRHPDARGGLVVIAIGLIFGLDLFSFLTGSLVPVILILIGAYLLFGDRLGLRGVFGNDDEKPKV